MSGKHVVPEAKEAMERFKMEAAGEVGVNLKNGYNGDLTARQAGSVGGQMVKEICPERQVTLSRTNRNIEGYADHYKLKIRVSLIS